MSLHLDQLLHFSAEGVLWCTMTKQIFFSVTFNLTTSDRVGLSQPPQVMLELMVHRGLNICSRTFIWLLFFEFFFLRMGPVKNKLFCFVFCFYLCIYWFCFIARFSHLFLLWCIGAYWD